jgi:hypothetical protein
MSQEKVKSPCTRAFDGAGKGIKLLKGIKVLFTEIEVCRGIWGGLRMVGHTGSILLCFYLGGNQVRSNVVQHQIRILVIPVAVVILKVVKRVMLIIPLANHNCRILLATKVLQGSESRSNLMGNDPLEMVCRINS